jgi:hypothetical protein
VNSLSQKKIMLLYFFFPALLAFTRVPLKAGESQKLVAHLGDTVDVELEGLPSAGFFWEVASTPKVLQYKRAQILPVSSGRLGGKQTTVFKFRASDLGEGLVVFRYGQVGRVQLSEMTISELFIHVDSVLNL